MTNTTTSKGLRIAYWVLTILVAVAFIGPGLGHLTGAEQIVQNIQALNLPLYMMTVIGTAKVLGAIGILQPVVPMLKEWAYAGMTFLMIGASFIHVLNGDPITQAIPPLVLLGLVLASRALWKRMPSSRTKSA